MRGITIGQGSLNITVVRRGTETVMEQLEGKEIEVIEGTVAAPLWGMPPPDHEKGRESKPEYTSVKEKGENGDESKDT